jgi:hypothetical protein
MTASAIAARETSCCVSLASHAWNGDDPTVVWPQKNKGILWRVSDDCVGIVLAIYRDRHDLLLVNVRPSSSPVECPPVRLGEGKLLSL